MCEGKRAAFQAVDNCSSRGALTNKWGEKEAAVASDAATSVLLQPSESLKSPGLEKGLKSWFTMSVMLWSI